MHMWHFAKYNNIDSFIFETQLCLLQSFFLSQNGINNLEKFKFFYYISVIKKYIFINIKKC